MLVVLVNEYILHFKVISNNEFLKMITLCIPLMMRGHKCEVRGQFSGVRALSPPCIWNCASTCWASHCSVMNILSLVLCSMPTPGWQWVISSSELSSLVCPPEDRIEQSVGEGWGQPALFWALRLLGSVHASVLALILNSLSSEWQQIFRNYKDCL